MEFISDINLVLNGIRSSHGPSGPRELAAEHLIQKAARGDFDGVYAILRNELAHPDVADRHGYTALAAAAVRLSMTLPRNDKIPAVVGWINLLLFHYMIRKECSVNKKNKKEFWHE